MNCNTDDNWVCSWPVLPEAISTAETCIVGLAIVALVYSREDLQRHHEYIFRETTWSPVAALVRPAMVWRSKIRATGLCMLVLAGPGFVANWFLPYLVPRSYLALVVVVVRIIGRMLTYGMREVLMTRGLAKLVRCGHKRRRVRQRWFGYISSWCLWTLIGISLPLLTLKVDNFVIAHQTSAQPHLTPEYLLLEARTRLQSAEKLQTLHLAQKEMFCDLSYMTLYCLPRFQAKFADHPSERLAQNILCHSPPAPPANPFITDDFCDIAFPMRHRLAEVITAYEDWNVRYYTPLRERLDSTHHSLVKLPPPNLFDNMSIAPPTTQMTHMGHFWFCFCHSVLQDVFGARWAVMRWLLAHAQAATVRRQMSEVRGELRVFVNESITTVWARMDWGTEVVQGMQELRRDDRDVSALFRTLRLHVLDNFWQTPGPDVAVEAFLEQGFGRKAVERSKRAPERMWDGVEGDGGDEDEEEGLLGLLCELERWEAAGGWLAATTWQGDEAWRGLMGGSVLEIQLM